MTRGEGVTIASYRFPHVVAAIHDIASTRPPGFTDEQGMLWSGS